MKIYVYVLMVTCLVLLSSHAAFADEVENGGGFEVQIDDLTRTEIEIMDDHNSVVLRLLQLEKAVTCNIYKGEYLVSFLLDIDVDTLEFETILAEMQLLLEEIQSVHPDSSDAVFLFVELKQDAIELSTEFRDALHTIVDEATREMLKDTIQALECGQVEELDEQIYDQIVLFNKRQLENITSLLGLTDVTFLQGYQNKNISLQQVKLQLANKVQTLTEDKQFQIYSKVKEDQICMRIQAIGSIDNLTSQYMQRTCMRLRERINNSESIGNETIRQYLQQRMRLRLHQYGDNDSGQGGEQGSGSGDGSGGSGQGSGDGSGGDEGSGGSQGSGEGSSGDGGSGDGSGDGSGGDGSDDGGGNGSDGGNNGNGQHNGQGGGGGP